MKKIIKSYVSVIIAAVGFVGGIIWGFRTNWNEMEPIILILVSFLEIIGFIILRDDINEELSSASLPNHSSAPITQIVVVNPTTENSGAENDSEEKQKSVTRILFVDDKHLEYKMVSILKKAGWVNTKSARDITDLDDVRVIEADIIFVDINGVGLTLFEDQGLGLASALKRKYPQKKIVIYSAETKGDRFHRALREVDDCLPKDAEPYQFINLIESFRIK